MIMGGGARVIIINIIIIIMIIIIIFLLIILKLRITLMITIELMQTIASECWATAGRARRSLGAIG